MQMIRFFNSSGLTYFILYKFQIMLSGHVRIDDLTFNHVQVPSLLTHVSIAAPTFLPFVSAYLYYSWT